MKKIFFFFILSLFFIHSQQLFSQNNHFQGTWTKAGTTYVFEFDLYLHHSTTNQIEGFFHWKVIHMDEKSKNSIAHYDSRIGATAKEFVKGTFNPSTKFYKLSGYKKEDPNLIISLDDYIIRLEDTGEIGGDSKAHGTWLGRINGKRIDKEQITFISQMEVYGQSSPNFKKSSFRKQTNIQINTGIITRMGMSCKKAK